MTLSLLVNPVDTTNLVIEICETESYFVGSSQYTSTGQYTDILTSSLNCDSIVNLDLVVLEFARDTLTVEVCEGYPYLGNVYSSDTELTDVYPDSGINGCDSILTTYVQIVNCIDSIDVAICDSDSLLIENAWVHDAGIYNDTLTAVNGNDSIMVITLSILPLYSDSFSYEICQGDSILINGTYWNSPGWVQDTLTSVSGCDSVVFKELFINPIYEFTYDVEICEGETFYVEGADQTEAGLYTDIYSTVDGCDSTININLIVHPTYLFTDLVEICQGEFYFFAGANQSVAGTYYETYISQHGCDSIRAVALTVNEVYLTPVSETICSGDSILIAGEYQFTTGVYYETLTSVSGCDSILQIDLAVIESYTSYSSVSICEGDSHFTNGNFYTETGIYLDTLIGPTGCEAYLETTLTVLSSSLDTIPVVICDGEQWFAGGGLQNTSGYYTDIYNTFQGCDSVIVTELIVAPVTSQTVQQTICQGETYFAGGAQQFAAGTYYDTYPSFRGCDSTIVTELTVLPSYGINEYVEICEGDSVLINNQYQSATGVYPTPYTTIDGCDSILFTNLTVNTTYEIYDEITICGGDSLFVGGAYQSSEGIYTDNFQTISGCDSVIVTTIYIDPLVELEIADEVICYGEEIQLEVLGSEEVIWTPSVGLSCTDCPNPIASPALTTTYAVSAQSCLGTVTTTNVTVTVNQPPTLQVDQSMEILLNDSTMLHAITNDPNNLITWMDNDGNVLCEDCEQFMVQPTITTSYLITAEDPYGCTTSDQVEVTVNDACAHSNVQVPNIISPNGDGFNDYFQIQYEGVQDLSLLRIYNRWGELVYETRTIDVFWDGTFRGQQLNPGVYVYYLEGHCLNSEEFHMTGNVTIIK